MTTTRGHLAPTSWDQILDSSGAGKPPYQTLTNAVRVIEHDPMWGPDRLWYDEFGGRIMLANSPVREWRDDDDVALTVHMQDTTGMSKIQKHLVSDAVTLVARKRGRHVVREYLLGLKWDGTPRIDLMFEDHWGADSQPTDYVRAASRNLLIGLVARVMKPGCKCDTMPVFEGKQGIFKSSALSILGGEWYAAIDDSAASKDFLQALRGKWLIELCELNSLSKTESAHIKGMLSRPVDTYRASFGRRTNDIPRQCVFAGTTNHDDWLADETGGRRFWPIRCGEINLTALAIARDQLFAEALVAYTLGASWWQMPATTAEEQRQRQQYDEWTPIITPWLAEQCVLGATSLFIKDIFSGALKMSSPDQMIKADQMRIAKILKLLGWKRDQRDKFWVPPHSNGATFS